MLSIGFGNPKIHIGKNMGEKRAYLSQSATKSSIDHMLRSVHTHQIELSVMADQKANILITASSIILTLALSRYQADLKFVLITLIGFTLLALLLAILAVMPKFLFAGNVRGKDGFQIFNPLFFGHFASLKPEEYLREMEIVLSDDSNLFKAYLLDIYSMGQLLFRKKYKYIKLSYISLFLGLFLSFAIWVFQIYLEM